MKKGKVVSIYLNEDILEFIDDMSKHQGRSRSNTLTQLLKQCKEESCK